MEYGHPLYLKKGTNVYVPVRFSKHLVEEIERLAELIDFTRDELINTLVEHSLKHCYITSDEATQKKNIDLY